MRLSLSHEIAAAACSSDAALPAEPLPLSPPPQHPPPPLPPHAAAAMADRASSRAWLSCGQRAWTLGIRERTGE